MDNFNDYYDVRLKMDRAFELHQLGVEVYNDDLCNEDFLYSIFNKYNFTHVAHLAAQAGVRYSLENPLAYIRANVEGQVVLLDVLREFPLTKLVYASSSSVYGKKAAVPFRLSTNTDRPGNMYAASKKTDELLGTHYCMAHNLSAVGLRFFTVYGPWGRPDMAIFKFAEALLDGKGVPLYHVSGDKELARDFTYVDDIISGVVAALDYKPTACGIVFNLGFGHPVSVPKMVELLRKQLGVQGKIKNLPLPPTEILQTWADTTVSQELLGFNPGTNLEKGITKFVVWYKGYRKQREDEKKLSGPTPAEKWFSSILQGKYSREKIYKAQNIQLHNQRLQQRLAQEKQKYFDWAKKNDIPLPEAKRENFIFFEGMDSPGGDIIRAPSLKNNIEALKARCLQAEQCIAFNTNGMLKDKLTLKEHWQTGVIQGEGHGLYVADIDVCKADLHDCSKYADCHSKGPGQYICTCKQGFVGNGQMCVLQLGQPLTMEVEREYDAVKYSLINVTQAKQGKKMMFLPGVDSPGGDYLVASQHINNQQKLVEVCRKDPICLGVNSNGMMKRTIQRRERWVTWTNDRDQGIYLFDLDYCKLVEESCPDHSTCQSQGNCSHVCVCDKPYILKNGECVKQPPIRGELLPKPDKLPAKVPARILNFHEGAAEKSENKFKSSKVKTVAKPQKNLKAQKNIDNKKNKENLYKMEDADIRLSKENNNKKDDKKKSLPDSNNNDGVNILGLNIEDENNQDDTEEQAVKELPKPRKDRVQDGVAKMYQNEPVDKQRDGGKTVKEGRSGETVHILMSVDENSYPGVPVVINSIQKHTKHPVKFHILDCGKSGRLQDYLNCYSIKPQPVLEIVRFSEDLLSDSIKKYIMQVGSQQKLDYLGSIGNFARFFFHKMFPTLEHAVYLDADLVVKGDIHELWEEVKGHSSLISAATRNVTYSLYLGNKAADLYHERYNKKLDRRDVAFNAGVYHINLDMWRQQNVAAELNWWIEKNKDMTLWKFGTQPLLLLVAYKKWHAVPKTWNIEGLGWNKMPPSDIETAKILHWTGKGKPWHKNPSYELEWLPWKPLECQGHGKCLQDDNSKVQSEQKLLLWKCVCDAEHTGYQCQKKK